ncbi:glutamine synthetase [Aestuariivirga sp.]|uniref:glutamine synthetase n=1 Tax=Aestuariivirga sp. TaxID=2650926 RepID=UPI003BACC53A
MSAAQPEREPLISFVTTDYAGITRGRSIASSSYAPGKGKSLGWVPANMSLTPFDLIADPNPWGSSGDLRLLPDDDARFQFSIEGSATPLDIVMSDIVELDGTPWVCCPRSFLKQALRDLETETGLSLMASFEHEFQILNAGWPAAPAFALQALRRADPFGPALMAALRSAGVEPEVFIAEYGKDQFEITLAPAAALAAADRAVLLRETVRELSRNRGWQCSFAPKTAVDGVGNGVHIHFSFRDAKGAPATYDAAQPGGVSAVAGSFVAGILRHLPALCAFTAPSPISYLRLQPHHWSSSYTWFGDRDREASLRICPVNRIGGADPAKAFNIEYRPADATSCPHLALGVLVRAGLEGIRSKLSPPPLFSGDPALLAEAERQALGLKRLPQSLSEALETLLADATVCGWFAPVAVETYTGMKRMEMTLAGDTLDDAMCHRYAVIY